MERYTHNALITSLLLFALCEEYVIIKLIIASVPYKIHENEHELTCLFLFPSGGEGVQEGDGERFRPH